MSENIQSISLGSYTIGNTNELTFSAGPGITIDSPSAGTVRIGNDETVLYSATSTATAYNLSESFKNFDSFKVLFRYNDGYKVWTEFDNSNYTNNLPSPFLTTITAQNTYSKMARFSANDAGTQINRYDTLEWVNFTNKIYGNNIVWIQEVVGINRISSSNT